MTDYETIERRRNIVVGIFVVVAMCALVWLIFMFRELPTVVSRYRSFQVFVQFPTAPGVDENTPVRFCGYQIGSVTKVMAPEVRVDLNNGREYHQTVVVLSINEKYANIPSNVEVKLMKRGLGSSYVELKVDPATLPPTPRDPNRPKETTYLAKGMWLQGSTGMTSEFFPEESQEKLEKLVDRLNVLAKHSTDIIGDPNSKENVKKILVNVSEATKQTAQTLEELQKFFVAGTEASEEISKAATELRQILVKVNSSQGTVGKLVSDARLYDGLVEGTEQLQEVLQDLKSLIAAIKKKYGV
ncbi:MAG: MlaD family protein [Planctomycetota bacterium]